MATPKLVSAMSPILSSVATFTYGINGGGTYGKLAVNAADGLAILDSSANLPANADGSSRVGTNTNRFGTLNLSNSSGAVLWNDGTGNGSQMSYTVGQGPSFFDATAGFTATFDVHGITANRRIVFPDVAGTVTVLGNTSTGSGGVVLATNPTLSGLTLADATNVVLNTTTGTKIGTATTQKLAFYNSTPIVQPTGDLITGLQNLGLLASITLAIPSAATGRGVTVQNSQSIAYPIVLTDAGKVLFHPAADTTARTWTIPANASVAFPIGTEIDIINETLAGVLTIAITTDTLLFAGAGTTGSRTLAASGWAKLVKITTTKWIITNLGGLT